jgi:MFS family permease
MPPFLSKFFPDVYVQQQDAVVTNSYCSFDSQLLSLFTSCFFLAAMISSALASGLSAKFGRKASMFVGAVLYLVGSVLNVAAVHTSMLIIGRLLIGFGCGFINQSVPVFLAEIPPVSVSTFHNVKQRLYSVVIIVANNNHPYPKPLSERV